MSKRPSAAAVEERPVDDTFTTGNITIAPTPANLPEEFRTIPLSRLVPSTTNPRRHFDETRIADMARSLAEKGCIEPIVVRAVMPKPAYDEPFEIVAGECRYRAAKLARLAGLPAVIRPYTDEQVLEIQLLENLSRSDLTPLEQARGFRALIASQPDKHNIHTIASRVGMSPAWVWDRLKLLDLVPELQALLDQEEITIGHAILLARLKPDDQAKTADQHGGGLYRYAGGLHDDLFVPVTVRELERWIDKHIRFDAAHAAQAQPLAFGATAEVIEARAAEHPKAIVAITYDDGLSHDVKADGPKIYLRGTWARADGRTVQDEWADKTIVSPVCDHAVLGVVAIGPHKGEAFDVCVAKKKCRVHWAKEIDEQEQTEQLRTSGKTKEADAREAKRRDDERQARERQDREQKAWDAQYPALRKTVLATAQKAPAKLSKDLFRAVVTEAGLPKQTTPATLAKMLLLQAVESHFVVYGSTFWNRTRLLGWVKALGVDMKALEPKSEKSAKPAKVKKGGKRS